MQKYAFGLNWTGLNKINYLEVICILKDGVSYPPAYGSPCRLTTTPYMYWLLFLSLIIHFSLIYYFILSIL